MQASYCRQQQRRSRDSRALPPPPPPMAAAPTYRTAAVFTPSRPGSCTSAASEVGAELY